jgi:hypothetical protein
MQLDLLIVNIRNILKDFYLLSFKLRTFVIIFLPEKYEELQFFLANHSEHHAGCCYYFSKYSVALWQDLEDVIGFKNEVVCVIEIFEEKINRDFYWRI